MYVCGRVCVCGTSRTADVTVTKIAGYVRVRNLMNLRFFSSYFGHSYFLGYAHFLHAGYICTYTLTGCATPTSGALVWSLAIDRCSDFDYIRMDMSEQHANMKDSPSQAVTCYLSAAIHE